MSAPEVLGKGGDHRTRIAGSGVGELSGEHYLLILRHRKWFILAIFLIVACGTGVVSYFLPNVYTSETLILVDPQQVPDDYVKPTVSGDVRNRLGTLSQQILSTTRLQRIIDTFNLYAKARKDSAQEEVITQMREDISIELIDQSGAGQRRRGEDDLQAFKITYSGNEPRVVAQVTNELASLFIEENLKARERVATGTSEFIEDQLVQTEKQLEELEAKLRDFKLKHLGEMPDQQATNLQLLGQLQSRLQMVVDAQNRAEQQKSYLQAILAAQPAPDASSKAAETDAIQETSSEAADTPNPPDPERTDANLIRLRNERRLAELLSRYGEDHPDVLRLKREVEETREIEQEAAREFRDAKAVPTPVQRQGAPLPVQRGQSIEALRAQLTALDSEIANQKKEQERVLQSIASYQRRVETVPIREQEVADLVREYEMSREHYSNLLAKGMSAREATQLEVRQKGERFTILDPAQVPEKPSRPDRILINLLGSIGGLALGVVLAFATEFLGFSITIPQQILAATGVPVLGVIPIILTGADRLQRRRWTIAGAATGLMAVLVAGALLVYHYRTQIF